MSALSEDRRREVIMQLAKPHCPIADWVETPEALKILLAICAQFGQGVAKTGVDGS